MIFIWYIQLAYIHVRTIEISFWYYIQYKKNTYMQFYIAIGIAGIGPYRLWLLPVTVK
jgi:hypothetical protein